MGKKTGASTSAASPQPKKARSYAIPSVASMGALVGAGSSQLKPVYDERLHLHLLEYCQMGSVYSDVFSAGRLYQMQLNTSAQPSPIFMLKKQVEVYGDEMKDTEEPQPLTLEEVGLRYKAVYQFAGKKTEDLDTVCWAKNANGWYISEETLKEFLMYFDDLMDWRSRIDNESFQGLERAPKIVVHTPNQMNLPLTLDKTEDELKCEFEVVKETTMDRSVFDLPPPTFPGRITILSFEMVSAEKAHAVFGGNTKPFQAGFVELKIRGRSVRAMATDQYAEFYRVLEHLDLTDDDSCFQQLQGILTSCLKGSPVIVRVADTKCDQVNLAKVLAKMVTCKNVRIET